MTTGQIVVIALRIALPLLILKKPLAGGILAMLLDGVDVILVELFGEGGMGSHYHSIDKILDLWYLGLEVYVSLQWTERLPRLVSIGLFTYRVLGVALFELTGWRPILFIFPNLFENWFLFYLIRSKWLQAIQLDTWSHCLRWLLVLYIPKIAQEYILHVAEAQPWNWFKEKLDI